MTGDFHDLLAARTVPSTGEVEDDRVTVVVASRNRRNDLASSLGRHHGRVILVDNASQDDTVETVRTQFPRVRTMRLPAGTTT